ncbi:hypothetical protein GCM10022378_11690 [Salinicoccus jeotgali]|uniref:Tail spike domain-containing protein n=1 Tax=Salinicoccus jeotgali TaxID=381634 RepID=A0ABP7ER82_9STAP
MIYLFDRQKKLQKIIPKKHLLSAIQTVELNGLYQLSVEVPLFYETKEGTQYNHKKNIERAWFAGHYDRHKRFQLYKIHARKVRADNKRILLFDGVHIFFDEAKAMGNIHDRRFRDYDIKPVADAAFNPIGWYVKDYDVTGTADINFYRDSVANARSLIIEKFGVEFDYGLTFDGRKIISKDLYIKKRLGKWTGKRFAYGTNLLNLTQEQDESEVYTAAVGRGRGEEAGDGFGPRLEFGDIEWSKDGITSPVGQNWIEIPSATAEYGYFENGEIHPRVMPEVIFENVENKQLLADSTYQWLLENCVPKATWKTDVARVGAHDLGDSVGVIYKQADIIKKARIHKIENNLLDDNLSKITLGDYQHFKTDRRQQNITAQIKRNQSDTQSYITQLKNDFDARYDAQTTAIENAYQQAVIDAKAETQAAEQRMSTALNEQKTTLEGQISTVRTGAINAANDYSDDVENRLNTSISTQRTEIESAISTAKTDAISQAESDAAQKAGAVQDDLETYKQTSQQRLETLAGGDVETVTKNLREVISDLKSKVGSIEFGETKESLQQQLDAAKAELDGLEVGGRNLLVGSKSIYLESSDNSDVTERYYDEENKMSVTEITADTPRFNAYHWIQSDMSMPDIIFEEIQKGIPYILSFDIRTTVENGVRLRFDTRTPDGALYSEDNAIYPSDGWQRHSTLKVEGGSRGIQTRSLLVLSSLDGALLGDKVEIRNLQLEQGNKATPYEPAPEDTEAKITTLNQQIEYIDGQLEAKLNRTEIEPIQNKITEYGTTLDANAESIGLLQDKTQLHDDDIEQWSNQATSTAEEVSRILTHNSEQDDLITSVTNESRETAEGLERVISRVSETESDISTAKVDIIANADLIGATMTRVDKNDRAIGEFQATADGLKADFARYQSDFGDDMSAIQSQVASYEANVDGFRTEVVTLQGDIDDADSWMADKGAIIDGNADAIRTRVWQTDIDAIEIGGRNLFQQSNYSKHLHNQGTINNSATSAVIKVEPNTTYTISYTVTESNRFGIYQGDLPNGDISKPSPNISTVIGYINTVEGSKINRTFTTGSVGEFIFVYLDFGSGSVKEPYLKLEKGNKATDWTPALEDTIQFTDFKLQSDGFLLGTTHVGGEDFATAIVGDATGMSMIANNVDFSNNITVQNQIKSWSIESVKADFASATIDYLTTGVIKNAMLDSEVVSADKLLVNTALVNKLTANTVFADDVKALSVEAAKANFGDIVAGTADLQFIKNKHLATESVDADKLKVNAALVNKLVADTAFINEINTMSIDAAKANFASATSEWFGANMIESDWLKVDTALFNRFTSDVGFINSLTAKSAFISNLNALDLSARRIYSRNGAHELNIEGGFMTITRDDNAKMDMNIDGISMYNSNGSKRFSMDSVLVTSAALGTSNANVYLAPMSNGEVRVSPYPDIPGDGFVDSYRYLPIRASGLYANFWNINSASTLGGAQHLYARPLSGGELRITLNGQTTNYQNLRADGAIVNKVVVNSLHGNSRHLFLQTLTDGEVRTTIAGNTSYYMPLRTDGVFIEGGKIGFNNDGNSYIGSNSEVRFTSNRFYEGDSTAYRDIRFANWRAMSHERYKNSIEEWNLDVLEIFRTELQLHTYKLDSEKGTEKDLIHQGIVIRENSNYDLFPSEWREGDGFNGNKVLWWAVQGVKLLAINDYEKDLKIQTLFELDSDKDKRIKALEKEVKILKEAVA